MKEFYAAVIEILEANDGAGQELEGVTILKNEFAGLTERSVIIRRLRENTLGQGGNYKQVEGVIEINALVQIDKRDGSALHRETKEAECEDMANVVEKVLMADPSLKSATYSQGITRHSEMTAINNRTYGEFQHQDGEFVFVRMELTAHYTYQDRVLSLRV